MKLKLDLHPIFNDSGKIESALNDILQEAADKRATEVEIIPGKGSGALKKTVLRFLDRPDVKSKYHRVEKDGDNWGRLFVHFRHDRAESQAKPARAAEPIPVACACCSERIEIADSDAQNSVRVECPWCGSPNRVALRTDRRGTVHAWAELDYPES